jgi:DNA-binding response OmpR family regulator
MQRPKSAHRLLLVDDEETILFAMGDYLSHLGFKVDMASEREEAEALLANVAYAAVVADLRLFGSGSNDGLHVIAAARERSLKTRIVLLSAFAHADIEADARRQGADRVLRKPKPLSEVAACLLDLLERN